MKREIEVGSKVVVVDNGRSFNTYSDMFLKMGFKNTNYNGLFENGTECIVFAKQDNEPRTLCGIRDRKGNESLINIEGLKLLSQSTLEEKFDIISEFCEGMGIKVTQKDIFKYLLRQKDSE